MKTPEDEAFEDIERKQNGGFKAKQAMAAEKLQEPAQESWREFASDYERGFIDGMQKQAQSSVDKAVNMMAQPAQEPVAINWDAVHEKLCDVWHHDLSADEGLDEIQDLIATPPAAQPPLPVQPAQEPERETLKLALEALRKAMQGTLVFDEAMEAFTAIKTALAMPAQEPDALTIVYQSGYHDGKQAALAGREWNFCERCGKRIKDLTVIHTCTPPQEGK